MIKKVEMYQDVCDGCGSIFEHPTTGEYLYRSQNDALKSATSWGMEELDGKLYCPDCVVWDNKTKSFKPKKKKQ